MDVRSTVTEFVRQGKDLFHLLRSDGLDLSHQELTTLRAQLHIIDNEATVIQNILELLRAKKHDS